MLETVKSRDKPMRGKPSTLEETILNIEKIVGSEEGDSGSEILDWRFIRPHVFPSP